MLYLFIQNTNKMNFKKQSNKKRKLEYIRQKNDLRLGGHKFCSFRISNTIDTKNTHERIKLKALELSKKYKLELDYFDVKITTILDDFSKGLVTVMFYVKIIKL